MWLKWLPWRFLVRGLARRHGFLDPMSVLSRLHRFAQPSEVGEPIELLRAGVVFHARGLMNTRAIQHNLDWIWPFWVEKQFDPKDISFIPRAFSVTHVNLTHRNWTAVGIPDCPSLPIVDPRGLVTPHWDGWSLDAWIVTDDGNELVPSRAPDSIQRLELKENLAVETTTTLSKMSLSSEAEVLPNPDDPVLKIRWTAETGSPGWLVAVLRPYNPEGVSFIHAIKRDERGWLVDHRRRIIFSDKPDRHRFSDYRHGDVHVRLPADSPALDITCDVGLATAAALYRLEPGTMREISVTVPLSDSADKSPTIRNRTTWPSALKGTCELDIPDESIRFLFDAAIRTLVLHSPGEVYPGPYTYKRFWFRDAAFIIDGLIAAGMISRAERALDTFPGLQTHDGYFRSQEGEWDSNGEALWIMRRFCSRTGSVPKKQWMPAILKAAEWILRKRIPEGAAHAGLLPAGFSAEHLGLNDFYYWDDFWGVAGLQAASHLSAAAGDMENSRLWKSKADEFLRVIEASLSTIFERRDEHKSGSERDRNNPSHVFPRSVPAAPDRRMDAGAIGSIVAGYPLQLWPGNDPRLRDTAEYLIRDCFEHGAFFQDMIHSGINAYLTLHVAQVLLRAGDKRSMDLIRSVASLASPTGQWPEAIHPATRGGCMGDGQHAWAAAEWVLAIRNCFVREECWNQEENGLIIGAGVPEE
ncbi:MAG: hypothetical protein AAB229_07185, partial [Candidatus Hydrogenedentota bacterium]